jgi:hypothetical protein
MTPIRREMTAETRNPRTLRRRPPGAAAAALLACAALACRAPGAARNAAPAGVPPAADPKESRPAPREVGASAPGVGVEAPPRAVAMDARVLVMPSGATYLLLRAGPAQIGDAVAWDVLYQAGQEPEDLVRPDAEAGRASAAHELFEVFRPFAEVAHLEHLSVTAMFGEPGGPGAIEQRWFARDARPWRAEGVPRRLAVAQVPAFDLRGAREPGEEDRARDAAAQFISDADRADYDAAWSRMSALAKAELSRTEFDRRLAERSHADTAGDPKLYLLFSAPGSRFLPGSFVEAWIVRETADGFGIEALVMRVDDDFEWRVAAVVELSGPPAAPTIAAPSREASSI